jgi:hypothetical protein
MSYNEKESGRELPKSAAEVNIMKCFATSALERVFLDAEPKTRISRITCLSNERASFAVACQWGGPYGEVARAEIVSPISSAVTLRKVGHVPATFLRYESMANCKDFERTAPGLYPDVLEEFEGEDYTFQLRNFLWQTLFVTVDPTGIEAGEYPVTVRISAPNAEAQDVTVTVKVLPVALPKQEMLLTQWFHSDGFAAYYREKIFSPSFWRHLESFLSVAAKNGINLILTPVFTPPLDTAVGGERDTVQLVDVEVTEEGYRFGFAKLRRWVRLCQKVGITHFEISHFFTQWGAYHAPKIMGKKDGKLVKLFGWETEAAGAEYRAFLDALLPRLLACLKKLGVDKNCIFHVSDEPIEAHLDSYRAAKEALGSHLEGYTVMDALSHYEFYEAGLVTTPVIATTAINSFLEKGYERPWVYYCCGQGHGISNRHFCHPLAMTRAMGAELYKFDCPGFLQWGYNFYNSVFSLRHVDPFRVTDADGNFPAGDAFSVYPGTNGAWESLRIVAFTQGLYDMRALRLLETKMPREEVIALVEEGMEAPLAFDNTPSTVEWITAMRARVNAKIQELFC